MKQKTFMQMFREWERMGGRVRASLDHRCVERFGYHTALAFDRYDSIKHAIAGCTIHTRINYRAAATKALGEQWRGRSLELNRMWRNWS
ncbi:hypothetical protein CF042_05830 [Klebsiella pneumoniae]|nr:hypothetical protein [Klebsiella pneumoniae]